MGKSRIAMIWDEELKTRVTERVGPRGLTAFTVAAVQARLDALDAGQPDAHPLAEPEVALTAPEPETDDRPEGEVLCPQCSTPLIDGECWTCL